MKLSIQAQAFVSLIIKFSIALAVIFAIMGLVTLVPLDLLIGSTSVLIMLFCIYNLYQIELMRLKREQDAKIDSK
jgi:predicted Co/Zn/Cd cation transporter (cation efflux family)